MTEIAHALYGIGFILLVAVAIVYVRRSPKLSAELQAEFDKLHIAAQHLLDNLHLVHQAASAPTAIAFLPAQPVVAAPPAPAPVAAPPAPAAAAPVNDSDPTAPGFVAPPAAAQPAPPPAAPAFTPDPHNLDFVRDAQGAVAVTDYAQLTVPEGWRGTLLVQTNERPGTLAYSTTLNGAYPQHRDPPDANNPYWLVYGVAPRPGDIVMTDRTVRLDVQQPAGATVAFDFQPYAVVP